MNGTTSTITASGLKATVNGAVSDAFRTKIKELRAASLNLIDFDLTETERREARVLGMLGCTDIRKRVFTDVDAETTEVDFSSDTPLLNLINGAISQASGTLASAGFTNVNNLNDLAKAIGTIVASIGLVPLDVDVTSKGTGFERLIIGQVSIVELKLAVRITLAGTNVIAIKANLIYPLAVLDASVVPIVDCAKNTLVGATVPGGLANPIGTGTGQPATPTGNGSSTPTTPTEVTPPTVTPTAPPTAVPGSVGGSGRIGGIGGTAEIEGTEGIRRTAENARTPTAGRDPASDPTVDSDGTVVVDPEAFSNARLLFPPTVRLSLGRPRDGLILHGTFRRGA